MAKLERKSNFRVIVEPKRLGDFGSIRVSDSFFRNEAQIEKDYIRRCNEIVEQIKRHVDEVDSVQVEYDVDTVCGYCGREWEVEEGLPTCCQN